MRRIVLSILVGASAIFVLFFYVRNHIPTEAVAAAYYRFEALTDTGAANRVAAIYLNYRIFDSLLETLMLLISVLAVVHVSWRKRNE